MAALMIPYTRHTVTPDDEAAVLRALRSGVLTQGPEVEAFEAELAALSGAAYAVCVNSGTAALHLAYLAAGARRFIIPAISFVATANAVLHAGREMCYVDVEYDTGMVAWHRSRFPSTSDSRGSTVSAKTDVGNGLVPVHGLDVESSVVTAGKCASPRELAGKSPQAKASRENCLLAIDATDHGASTQNTSSPETIAPIKWTPSVREETHGQHKPTVSTGIHCQEQISTTGPTECTPSDSVEHAEERRLRDTTTKVGVSIGGSVSSGDVVDACHGPIAHIVGALATVLSMHPAKFATTGEGGAILTNDADFADRCRLLRSHGRRGTEMVSLGYNYRMSEINAALGRSQLARYHENVRERRRLAHWYDQAFAGKVRTVPHGKESARHLYQLLIEDDAAGSRYKVTAIDADGKKLNRRDLCAIALRDRGIGTAIHYPVIPLQPYYRERYGYRLGQFPGAEWHAAHTLSIPLFPTMTEAEQDRVISAVLEVCG